MPDAERLSRLLNAAEEEAAATPEGRVRVTDALRRTLAEIEAGGAGMATIAAVAANDQPGALAESPFFAAFATEFTDLAGVLVMLADRAEWLAERARNVVTPSPPPEPD